MSSIQELEKEIKAIKERNSRVEMDKMWETSTTRKALVALLTAFVISLFFLAIGVEEPFLNAIVPTLGFLLSTLALNRVKRLWIRNMLESKDLAQKKK
jgi:hypothetical protein